MCKWQYNTKIGPKHDNTNNAFRERHHRPVLVLMPSDKKKYKRLNHTYIHTIQFSYGCVCVFKCKFIAVLFQPYEWILLKDP